MDATKNKMKNSYPQKKCRNKNIKLGKLI